LAETSMVGNLTSVSAAAGHVDLANLLAHEAWC
jgi:hypothetical protein